MSEPESSQTQKDRVCFHYIKSNFFRVVHANGVHGGISPNGELQMGVFNERAPIPQKVFHRIEKRDGSASVGEEIISERVGKDGIVREVEVEIVMSEASARVIHTWLGEHIKKFDELHAKAEK